MKAFEHVVVGKGLIGAAAARHLSERGDSVAVIGPDEPGRPEAHRGVFASHYDEGRLTRLVGRDLVYSKLAEIAIDAYPDIEERSGIRFHHPVGALVVEAPDAPRGAMMKKDPLETARMLGREIEVYEPGDRGWKRHASALELPATDRVLYEPAPAGYINPRQLIRAQLAIAEGRGARVLHDTVTSVTRSSGGLAIETASGERLLAAKVLVAAGAFTPFNRLLPRALPLELETETILLARVSEVTYAMHSVSPTVVHFVDDPELSDVYMTPPIRYPDGAPYVKIGANTVYDRWPESFDEVGEWFRCGDSDRAKPAFERVLRSLWPGVDFLATATKRCIISRTPSGYPILEEVEDGLFVAAGGNGGSAKSSDALGGFAARLVTEPSFDYLAEVKGLI